MQSKLGRRHLVIIGLTTVLLGFATSAFAQAPDFEKIFLPDTVGPGSVSTLRFDINNEDSAGPVDDLAFTDALPAGVIIATPANAASTCGGTLTAPDGGTTITFTDGVIGAWSSCFIDVDVTSSTLGTHTNTSGDLTSSAGNSGTATDNLSVLSTLPGFSKSFSPSSVPLGSRSTLTFTIDNTLNGSQMIDLAFTDNLPTGMVVAGPANASTNCTGATVTAVTGTDLISFLNGSVAAGASCTVSVDVIGGAVGSLANTSEDLTYLNPATFTTTPCGKAGAILLVTVDPLALAKSFTDDPVPPGGTVTLEFTILNANRFDSATGIAFTDDLDAALTGLAAVGLPVNDICGAGSTLTGTTVLTLSGGSLAPGASCSFSVTLQVPAGAATGAYVNTTSSITATVGGSPVTGGPATEVLFVAPAPVLTKSFTDDPVGAGTTTNLEFTITNTSPSSDATDIQFTDDFYVGLPTASGIPAAGFCGPGSTATFTPLTNPPAPASAVPARLTVSGASLAPSASCTFDITLDVAVDVPSGTYPNTTSPITATVDAAPVVGNPATDDLVVVAGPQLLKEFTDDPVSPGDTVNLQFTLSYDAFAPGDATSIAFTDDLNAALTGLAAIGLPVNDVCGAGSQISGTTNLSFTGGTLAPGASCIFNVTLQVPGTAPSGAHANTTSNVTSTVSGVTALGSAASDDLRIAGLTLTKEFTDDPVLPGGTVTLSFTIDNVSPAETATNITFEDDLDATLDNLAATGLPLNDICGAGSSLTGSAGNTLLTFQDGTLGPGASCTFDVILQVPGAAASDTYVNTTSGFSADMDGSPTAFDNASDNLVVDDNLLEFSKEFTDDPVPPGATVNLEFTLTNLDSVQAATGISFFDDLDAALTGLASISGTVNNVCGAGSQMTGTSFLSFTGGSLPAGGSCTVGLTLQVPGGTPLGTIVTNTSSVATGTIGGLGVTGGPAIDDLQIGGLTFSKAFDGPTTAGGTPTLSFTIGNAGSITAPDLSFSDDLDAVLTGLVATGLPMNDVCGSGSVLSGTSFLTLTGATVLPAGSCTIDVPLQVPPAAAAGAYTNTTSDLFASGAPTAAPATDDLTIVPPPSFGKSFAPPVMTGAFSTLIFTIDNSASALAATNLDYTDALPAGLTVNSPSNASTTCGGTLTAVSGTSVISLTGGTVAAGASCQVQADVTSLTPGSFVNTSGDLTSSSGNSGPATDTLDVTAEAPLLSKEFNPSAVLGGATTTLSFTIVNTGAASTDIEFTDDLDAALAGLVAIDTPRSDVCGAGSQLTGASLLTLTGGNLGPGGSCAFDVTVEIPASAPPGTITNLTSPISAVVGGTPVTSPPGTEAEADLDILPASAAAVPTLSTWALVLLVSLLSLTGVLLLRRP